jgi:hypothetical protein
MHHGGLLRSRGQCCGSDAGGLRPPTSAGRSASFIIKEVIHRQSSAEGTTTDILITNENGLGSESLKGAA